MEKLFFNNSNRILFKNLDQIRFFSYFFSDLKMWELIQILEKNSVL
ncbi:hypothetical protein LEP1GSC172_2828 [Leptospira noguchii]|uniref:Uncharacterized protein n=1 Tax=Leptospira noguchii TaxID=28182 RepID=M6VD86_9LEPT|nr:hypothetical protein LEP1GSC172_2828 [Leptospira noguchii]